jgi:prepilin peptidase CpaA
VSEQFAKNILLGIMLGAAVASDMRTRKIPNNLVIAVFVVAMIASLLISGFASAWTALASVLTAVAFVLPMYLLRAIGGGDFKLMIAISPLLSWEGVIVVTAASLLWGSLLGVFSAISHGQARQLSQNVVGILMRVKPKAEKLHKIPYSVAILFGWITQASMQYYNMRLL